jgi:pyridoxal phosphate enzyme (YggS family)
MSDTTVKTPQRRLQENLRQVRERMAAAAQRSGRNPADIKLIAVTKYVDVQTIRIAIEQGLVELGESRVQELCQRAARIAESARRKTLLGAAGEAEVPTWHMIGHLQRNKVKKLLQWSRVIHSVDSLRLAEEISKHADTLECDVDILLELNLAGEKSKYGLSVGALDVVVEQVQRLPRLRVIGLMTMAAHVEDANEARPVFRRLREIAEDLREREVADASFSELSMGMTNDFEVAIEEGATMVRIGSALFEGLLDEPY